MNIKQEKTHYEFIRDIALAWITYGSKDTEDGTTSAASATSKRRSILQTTSIDDDEATTTREQSRKKRKKAETRRCSRVNDEALNPFTGKLSMRMDHLSHSHLPEQVHSREARCQLHKWVTGKRFRGGLGYCTSCNVNLCMKCYGLFHKTGDIVSMKDNLKKKYMSEE